MIDTRHIKLKDYWNNTIKRRVLQEFSEYSSCHKIYLMEKNILPVMGERRMCDVRTTDINDYFYSIRHESVGKRQKMKALLRWTFEQAVVSRLIPDNPVNGSDIIYTPYSKTFKLPDEAIRTIATAAHGHRLYNLLMTQITTGLSISELTGLYADDYDKSTGALNITRFVRKRVDESVFLSDHHSHKKARKIFIPSIAREYLEAEMKTGLIFSNQGELMKRDAYRRWYQSLGRVAGLSTLTGSMLEDNFGMRAAEMGANPKDLLIYLGYRTGDTVSKYYNSIGSERTAPAVAAEQYYAAIMAGQSTVPISTSS